LTEPNNATCRSCPDPKGSPARRFHLYGGGWRELRLRLPHSDPGRFHKRE
jgi:hypothetical protein